MRLSYVIKCIVWTNYSKLIRSYSKPILYHNYDNPSINPQDFQKCIALEILPSEISYEQLDSILIPSKNRYNSKKKNSHPKQTILQTVDSLLHSRDIPPIYIILSNPTESTLNEFTSIFHPSEDRYRDREPCQEPVPHDQGEGACRVPRER